MCQYAIVLTIGSSFSEGFGLCAVGVRPTIQHGWQSAINRIANPVVGNPLDPYGPQTQDLLHKSP